jgi:toxin ParE1/3/4
VPLEIVWSPVARSRLEEIRNHVAKDKPDAARKLAARIVAVVEVLRNYPFLGRVGAEAATRELVIGRTPYIVIYRVRGRRVMISTIVHGAQGRRSRRRKSK